MTDYQKYDADVNNFINEIDAEFERVTQDQLGYANKQNNSFDRLQGKFADKNIGTNIRDSILKNYQLVKDHFG